MVASLTFASLLLAATQPAVAGEPMQKQASSSAVADEEKTLPIVGRWTTAEKDGVLVAALTLVNTSPGAVDLLIGRGKSPGTFVLASIDGVQLSPVYDQSQEREMMSRRGPMPVYAPLAGKGEIVAGVFRFTLPAGYSGQPIDLEATVRAQDGGRIRLPVTVHVGGVDGV